MKKIAVAVLSVLLCYTLYQGLTSVYDSFGLFDLKEGISKFTGIKNDFSPIDEAYRIFDGEMVGEHNVWKNSNTYYDGSYYSQLSPNEKAVYDCIADCDLSNLSVSAKLPEPVYFYSDSPVPTDEEMSGVSAYISDTYQRGVDALMMDGSRAFYVKLGEGGSLCRYEYRNIYQGERYVWSIEEIETQIVLKDCYKSNVQSYIAQTQNAAVRFKPTGDTMYQKVKSIHDYVVNTGSYVQTPYSEDAYGLLVDKKAICSGFAKAFKLICDQNNIPCALVTGIGVTQNESGEHMWCLVQMDDGLWYAVDPTWDDYGGSEYLLVGSDTVSSFSGLTFSQTHIPSGDFTGFGYKEFVYPTVADDAYLK